MTNGLKEQSKLLSGLQIQQSSDDVSSESITLIKQHHSEFKQNKYNGKNVDDDEDDDDGEQSDEFFDCSSENQVDNLDPDHKCQCDVSPNNVYPSEMLNLQRTEQTSSKKVNSHRKHLYPFVVVNSSQDHSDIDSDEEDYNLRIYGRNDSGQGSSVETSSLKSDPHELLTSTELKITNGSDVIKKHSKQSFDNEIIDVLQDIDLSADESSLPMYRKSSVVNRRSPELSKKITQNSFTDIPLNAPVTTKPVNTYTPPLGSSNDSSITSQGFKPPLLTDVQPKTRLLSRSSQQKSWKIFGKVAVPVAKDPSPKTSPGTYRKSKKQTIGSSTTALILEHRPSHLPPKSVKEEKKHRQEYEEMITFAKRKELRDRENDKKRLKEKQKREDQLSNTVKIWKEDIIPEWNTCKNSKKVRDLWWLGVPPSVRGTVWKLAIGNNLHLTPELFEIFQEHAQERIRNMKKDQPVLKCHDSESSLIVSKENAIGLITLDVSRTFPSLCIFQKGGPYHEPLKTLLAAYTCHRPDIGYVQGMSFLAAMMLLNMDLTDAFIAFSNLLSRSCQMAFYMVDQAMMDAYFRAFDVLLEEHLPRLHLHFKTECLSHDIYLIDWIFTLFSKSLPLDTACRVWDLYCRDGEEFLFRTALGILLMHQDALLEMEFFRLAQYLTKLSNTITADELFRHIEKISFSYQKFQNALSTFKAMLKSSTK